MGRTLILLVDEHGVEYLPTLQTHSLDAVQVPDSVVKEWRRRKGVGTTKAVAGTAVVPVGHAQNSKPVATTTENGEIGRHTPFATPHAVPRLSRCLRRIKKMVPLDERGIWLLNHLLSQTDPEDQEELCRSVQEKLRKRKATLIRSKDRLKLECDRRCVFTKAANEIRTASAMIAEINRCNVLATIVKDHNHATRRSGQKRRLKQLRGRMNSAATAVPPSTATHAHGESGSSKSYPEERNGSRARGESKEHRARQEKQSSKDTRGPRNEILVPLAVPPPPLLLSTKMAKAPTSGRMVSTSFDPASKADVAGAASASAHNDASCDRRAGNKSSAPQNEGVSHLPSSFEGVRSQIPLGSQGRGTSALLGAGLSIARRKRAGWHQNPRSMGGGRRFGLPPLDERYGESVVDSWVQSPVALRLERPRCKSVDVAHLDQQAHQEYIEGIFRAGAAAAQRRGQKRRDGEEQGVMGEEAYNSSDLGSKSIATRQRRTKAGRSTRLISDPIEEEAGDSGDGGRALPPISSIPPSLPHLGGPGTGVFALASCDTEPTTGGMAHDGGGPVVSDRSPDFPPWKTSCVSRADDGSSQRVNVDEKLKSEALGFRSDGARKVFKQTQRLLEALRTPAGSCQVDPRTGARRGCGGGNVGGHSSIVVHHHQNNLHHGPGAGIGGDKAKGGGVGGGGKGNGNGNGIDTSSTSAGAAFLNHLPESDTAMWRVPRGDRPARLAEVFRCIAAPHIVRIECEIILHNSLTRPGGGRDGDGGTSGGGSCTWDDFVFAWECLADGILAGRALSGYWEHAHHDHGGANSALARSQRAADDLLSDGLMRALLSTRCYRPPGLDQLFVEWLDELLEVVRAYARRACSRVPSQHGLTAGLEWFEEVR
ncbi:unnamed protein product [Hapterophycus canaliculatus]